MASAGGADPGTQAAGLIVFRRGAGGGAEYLLLRAWAGHFTPPKGHRDMLPSGVLEDELTTAKRETAEEAGLTDLRVFAEHRFELQYKLGRPTRRIPSGVKRVAYFLALAPPDAAVVEQASEIAAHVWAPLEGCSPWVHDNFRPLLLQADQAVRNGALLATAGKS